jgi:hypothetical protein
MTLDTEMEGYARDCVRFAYLTTDPDMREGLLQLAREWMAAATHDRESAGFKQKPKKSPLLTTGIPGTQSVVTD